jgi:hypothetical protein
MNNFIRRTPGPFWVVSALLGAAVLGGCATGPQQCDSLPASGAVAAGASAERAAPAPAADAVPAAQPDPTAAALASDAALRKAIVGSWIVPRESEDAGKLAARETYRDDGTYSLIYFSARDCKEVLAQVDATWQINGGQLITRATRVSADRFGKVGDISIEQIQSLEGDRMALQSRSSGLFAWLGGTQNNVRVRSDGC